MKWEWTVDSNLEMKILRRLLRESSAPSADGRAVYAWSEGDMRSAIIYDTIAFFEFFELQREDPVEWDETATPAIVYFMEEVIKGYIMIQPPKNPCWKAWEVKAVASGADAKTTYGVGYAMSDNGLLSSDRKSVSAAAASAWAGVFGRKKRKSLEFDDISLPVEKRRTPDFPGDDCDLYRGDTGQEDPTKTPQLQRAYESEGWEDGLFIELKDNHRQFKRNVTAAFGGDVAGQIVDILDNMTDYYWDVHYNKRELGTGDE